MKRCWKETPAERPRFEKIVTTLKEIISYDTESSNENDIAPTPSLESIEETANQTRRHIRPNGPVSYVDLSRNVPASYIELTLDDSSSNVEHTLDDPGSYSREKKDDVGSNLEQSQDGRSSHHKLTQDDWGVAQDERYSDPKPTQDGNDYLLR